MLRPILAVLGVISLALGVLGIFLPVLPTTPFLLLSAALFARSSERLHRWLLEHPRLGPYVEGFLYGGGIPRHAKTAALLTLWPAIGLSCVVVGLTTGWSTQAMAIAVFLIVVAAAVTVYIVSRPTLKDAA